MNVNNAEQADYTDYFEVLLLRLRLMMLEAFTIFLTLPYLAVSDLSSVDVFVHGEHPECSCFRIPSITASASTLYAFTVSVVVTFVSHARTHTHARTHVSCTCTSVHTRRTLLRERSIRKSPGVCCVFTGGALLTRPCTGNAHQGMPVLDWRRVRPNRAVWKHHQWRRCQHCNEDIQ